MQTIARALVVAVLVCLLLPLAAGGRRHLHKRHHGHVSHTVTVRLRRSGANHPAHQPIRPAPAAMLPPDEDDDSDRQRLAYTGVSPFTLAPTELLPVFFSAITRSPRPVAPQRPLFQTLGVLLI